MSKERLKIWTDIPIREDEYEFEGEVYDVNYDSPIVDFAWGCCIFEGYDHICCPFCGGRELKYHVTLELTQDKKNCFVIEGDLQCKKCQKYIEDEKLAKEIEELVGFI